MNSNEENLIFIKEIGRLIHDYEKCSDHLIKDDIYEDILLLCEAVKK